MLKRQLGWLAVGLMAAGCVAVPVSLIGDGAVANGQSSLSVSTLILPGGLSTQAVVNNYTAASINHLILKLFKINGNTEQPVLTPDGQDVAKDVAAAQLGAATTFSSLGANTTYRIRCYAYKAPGEDPANLISTSDVGSYVDVTLTHDDRPTLATLKVKLIDVAFSGSATASGVVVTPGGYAAAGPESIQ